MFLKLKWKISQVLCFLFLITTFILQHSVKVGERGRELGVTLGTECSRGTSGGKVEVKKIL